MRFLLAGILAILPLATPAESFASMNAGESDSESVAPSSDSEQYCDVYRPEDAGGSCRNPYSPASPTNFEALIGPYLQVQGRRDVMLYDSRFLNGMIDMREGGTSKLGTANDQYEDSISPMRNIWRMPGATPGWSIHTYGGRN